MDLELDETQQLFRDTVRQYLQQEVPFSRVRECEANRTADAALWKALAEQGWLGVCFSSELGGGDGGLLEAGLLVEEVASRAALVPVVESLACGLALARAGEGDVAADCVRALVDGRATLTPAVLEAGDRLRDAVSNPECELRADGRLHGAKYFVDYAELASHHVVVARAADGPALVRVEAADPAVKCESTVAMGRIPQSIVRYDGARAERLAGAAGVRELVDLARALTSVQILACMQQALDQTVAYTNVRQQFGRNLSNFQAVQHHAADMSMHVESSRFLCYELLDELERGVADSARVALVKASVSRSVPEVTMLAHQLHGGHGFIEENDLYFFTLRGKDRSLAWGTAEECLEVVSGEVEKPARWL